MRITEIVNPQKIEMVKRFNDAIAGEGFKPYQASAINDITVVQDNGFDAFIFITQDPDTNQFMVSCYSVEDRCFDAQPYLETDSFEEAQQGMLEYAGHIRSAV